MTDTELATARANALTAVIDLDKASRYRVLVALADAAPDVVLEVIEAVTG